MLLTRLAQQFVGLTDDKVRLSSFESSFIVSIFGLGKAKKAYPKHHVTHAPIQARLEHSLRERYEKLPPYFMNYLKSTDKLGHGSPNLDSSVQLNAKLQK